MSLSPQNPKVGVAALIINKEGQILMGHRMGSHGAGTWAPPGGHLDYGETFEGCAVRETFEETGLVVEAVKFFTAVNDIMEVEGKHYVTIYMGCVVTGENIEPKIKEPKKCKKWSWMKWENVCHWADEQKNDSEDRDVEKPRLFLPILNLLEKHSAGEVAKFLQGLRMF